MNINYGLIDKECIPLVKYFNNIGLETQFSCSGHKDDKGVFYIIFSDKVADSDIEKFIMKYSNKYNHSPFLGKFVKWMRKVSDTIKCNWMYEINTRSCYKNYTYATLDYKTFTIE